MTGTWASQKEASLACQYKLHRFNRIIKVLHIWRWYRARHTSSSCPQMQLEDTQDKNQRIYNTSKLPLIIWKAWRSGFHKSRRVYQRMWQCYSWESIWKITRRGVSCTIIKNWLCTPLFWDSSQIQWRINYKGRIFLNTFRRNQILSSSWSWSRVSRMHNSKSLILSY